MSFLKKYYLIIILVFAITGVVFWRLTAKTGNNELKFNPNTQKIITPKRQDIQNNLVLSGKIDAATKANLTFPTSGKLVWVGVKAGDRVRKWQSIAGLDQQQLRKNLQTQYNNYRSSLSTFNDTQDTYKTTKEKYLVTDTIQRLLDRTQYSLDNSVINYEITDMAIKDATLVSPINGIVANLTVPVNGVNVTPLNTGFLIIDPASIYFRSEIDQEDIPKVQIDQAASLTLDSYPTQVYPSKINYLAFTPVDGQTSTVYEIRFDFPTPNQDLTYRLGMNGDATLVLAQSLQALTVPTETIYEDGSGSYVFQKINSTVLVKKYLKIGIQTDTDTEVLEGLTENDEIVLKTKI